MTQRNALIGGVLAALALAWATSSGSSVGAQVTAEPDRRSVEVESPGTGRAAELGEASRPAAAQASGPAATVVPVFQPLVILGVGMGAVLVLIIGVKIHPFITLVIAAMVVSVLAVAWMGEGLWAESIARVAAPSERRPAASAS
jgi:hypothetical protein